MKGAGIKCCDKGHSYGGEASILRGSALGKLKDAYNEQRHLTKHEGEYEGLRRIFDEVKLKEREDDAGIAKLKIESAIVVRERKK